MPLKSYKKKIRLGFLLILVCANILFISIFLGLSNVNHNHSGLNDNVRLLIGIDDIRNNFSQIAIDIPKYAVAGDKAILNHLNNEISKLKVNDSTFRQLLKVDSLEQTTRFLKVIVEKRIVTAKKVIDLRNNKGAKEALAFFQKSNEADLKNKFDAVSTQLFSEQINRTKQFQINDLSLIGSAYSNLLALIIFFNIIFPLIYFFLLKSFLKQEAKDILLKKEMEDKASELNKVYERITDAFIALDNNWNYSYVNLKAAQLHGLLPENLIGKNIWEVFPDVVNEPFYHALHEAKSHQQSLRLELLFSKTGQWFEDLIYPTEDGISIYYHDITEKKNASIALQASESSLKKSYEQFNLVAKATSDALWDWDILDNKMWGNEYFNQLLQIPLGESIKHWVFTDQLHPDDAKRVLSGFNQKIQDKATYWSDEFRFKIFDGSYRTMYNRSYLLYNQNSEAYRMVGAMQDITDLQLARQKLISEKEVSDSIINSLPGVFYLYNQQGKLYRWNKNFVIITGYSVEEISQLHPIDFFDDDEKELLTNKISNVFISGSDNVEAHLFTKDKRKIPYYFNGVRINYEGEDCLVGLGIDISEKVKAHEELRELATHLQHIRENERASIAREIHDELGQQLTGLKMDVSWISKKLHSTDSGINLKIEELLKLIDETVKTVRRISTELRPSILDDLGLVAAIEWQSEEFEKRSEIKTTFSSNVQSIDLSPDLSTALFRIFQESLTNVSRHSKATSVEAKLILHDTTLLLQIRDNGQGFHSSSIGHKKTLGLLGMKERTLLLDGIFEINSIPGQGTTVEIQVPLNKKVEIL